MVLLRLEVKVFPREPEPNLAPGRGASNSGFISRLMGNGTDRGNKEHDHEDNLDRGQEGSYDNLGEAPPAKKFVSFLMLLKNPEELTLGDLAAKITEDWAAFRPDQE